MQEVEPIKWRIFHTLSKLIENSDLEHISTKEICEASGISRQTFYRNFQDKYAVVKWHFDLMAERSLKQAGRTLTWQEAHKLLFSNLSSQKTVYERAAYSDMIMKQDIYRWSYNLYMETLTQYKKMAPTRSLLFQIDAAALLNVELAFKWGRSGMKQSPEEMAQLLDTVLPQELKNIFEYDLKINH